jgi:hypothetical protein
VQKDYLIRTGNLGKWRTGAKWTKAIITHTWGKWLKLWTERNQVCHGLNKSSRMTLQRELALAELAEIYTNRNNLLPQERELRYETMEEHIQRRGHLSTLQNWLNSHRELFQASIKEAQRRSIQGVRTITTYFRLVARTRFRTPPGGNEE